MIGFKPSFFRLLVAAAAELPFAFVAAVVADISWAAGSAVGSSDGGCAPFML
jgi:hypothetical protein